MNIWLDGINQEKINKILSEDKESQKLVKKKSKTKKSIKK